MPAETKEIAVAVVERDGHFLIGQRPPDVPLAGLWEFPGGKVRDGEDPSFAAVRECLEETGLHTEIVGEYPDVVYNYEHGRLHLRFFNCRPTDPQQTPQAPFHWVSCDELANYEFPPANVELLKRLTRN